LVQDFAMIRNAPATRKNWWRRLWTVTLRTLRGVVYLEDTPHRIALGSAAGILSSALPIFGQTFIGMILARLLRANVFASIPWSWLSNPFTTLPMWYGGYRLGLWLIPGQQDVLSYADLTRLAERFNHTNWSDGLSAMLAVLGELLAPLWLGCTILGLAMAVPGYWLVRAGVIKLQRRREARQAAWRRTPPVV
jgi:uncharacterized protein (DUF2062 family)